MDPISIGPFPGGMNNRQPSHALPEGTVRNIVNCDVSNGGTAKRRRGYTKVYSGLGTKFGYDCPAGRYFVEGPNIMKFNSDNTATVIWAWVTGTYCTFFYIDGVLYFSDGVVSLKIINDLIYYWGMAPPPAPVVSTTAGAYDAGTYQAAYCWVDANGVESGASPVVTVLAGENSGFIFSSLPSRVDMQAVALRIYLSTANGSELYHVADTLSASHTVLAGRYDSGTPLESDQIMPAPPGRIIRHYNARMWVADADGVAWYSDPLQPDRFRRDHNYQLWSLPLALMEPTTDGIWFATAKETWFYVGDPELGFQEIKKFDYGAVLGTGKQLPDGNVMWQSTRGAIKAGPSGECANVQEANVAVDTAESGATLIREQDGLKQFIASLKTPTISKMAASSWFTAEQIRRS